MSNDINSPGPGYRRLRDGEQITPGCIFYNEFSEKWIESPLAGQPYNSEIYLQHFQRITETRDEPQTPEEWEAEGPDDTWICAIDAFPKEGAAVETLVVNRDQRWEYSACSSVPLGIQDRCDNDCEKASSNYWRPLGHTLTDEDGWVEVES